MIMYDYLSTPLPTKFKDLEINTSFRVAINIQRLLDDPILLNCNKQDLLASYIVAFTMLYKNYDDVNNCDMAYEGIMWWLSCGRVDKVENYWIENRIMPDVDSNEFDIDDYLKPSSSTIIIDKQNINGEHSLEEVSKQSILCFNAPDNTVRYCKRENGDPAILSLYEDNQLIYSGFIHKFGIDLGKEDIHWFTFSALLSELIQTEGSALYNKIKIRSFNPDDYKGKAYTEYRNRMAKEKSDARVLGIMPYVERG